MIVFGINLPLPEMFLLLVFLFLVFLLMILYQLQRLQRMSREEKQELEELEKLAQDEKTDIEDIKNHEQVENADLGKFEREITDLEEDTETIYLKKLAPDLYKIQNYVLWAMQKGMSFEQIKQDLLGKGWKDEKLIDMVLNSIMKYKGYATHTPIESHELKVQEPVEKPKAEEKPIVEVETEKTVAIPKIEAVKTFKPAKSVKKPLLRKEKKPLTEKAKKKAIKRINTNDFKDVEKELKNLEKDLTKQGKNKIKEVKKETSDLKVKEKSTLKPANKSLKSGVKPKTGKTSKPKPNKPAAGKSAAKKTRAKKPVEKKAANPKKEKAESNSNDNSTVILQVDKGVDVHVKHK